MGCSETRGLRIPYRIPKCRKNKGRKNNQRRLHHTRIGDVRGSTLTRGDLRRSEPTLTNHQLRTVPSTISTSTIRRLDCGGVSFVKCIQTEK